jgi:mRNA interferase HigB
MKVHLIKKSSIDPFVMQHTVSKLAFESWLGIIKQADWGKPSDILNTFNSSDLLGKGSNRVVFNVAGNNYRVICSYYFGEEYVHLFICWIGTHAEYDTLNKLSKQYTICSY